MLTKREYQARAVTGLLKRLKKHQRVVAVAPTGSGKTVIAVAVLAELRDKRTLWVAHRIELLRQAVTQLKAAGVRDLDIGILSGPDKANPGARILVASVDILRAREVPAVDIIVIDEAHRATAASYLRIIEACPKALVLGLTATPERLSGEPLRDVFSDMFVVAQPVELIAEGYIAHTACYGIPKEKAQEILRGVKDGKDFNEEDLGKAMSKQSLMGDIVKECARLAPGAATIVFAVNREHGRALLARFKKSGRTTEYLDGDTPDSERAGIIDRLESGATEVVVNVDVLSEGFDCPPVKCIALARPTKSLTRFLQQVGRASRPWHRKRPIILDHAGNCWRFGLPEMPRDWSLDGRENMQGEAPVRLCPECEAVIAAGSKKCPECGAEIPLQEREILEQQSELQRLNATVVQKAEMAKRLRVIAKDKGAGEDWVQMVIDGMFRVA